VRIAPDAARTILPSAQQLYYVLTFNNGTETVREALGGALEKTVALTPDPVVTWNLVVNGYRNAYDAENGGTAVASGSPAPFTVAASNNPVVDVALSATQNGAGTLRYTLTYPTNPAVSGGRIYLEQLGGTYEKLITLSINSISPTTGSVPALSSGYYQLNVYLYNGRTAIKSDLVHIYDNLDTEAAFTFLAADFAEAANLSGLSVAIEAAKTARLEVRLSADGTGIETGLPWAPQAAFDALNVAIADAETVITSYGSGLPQTLVESRITALNTAVNDFTSASGTGSYTPGPNVGLYVGTSPSPEPAAGTTLADALAWLQTNAQSNTDYTVLLGADEVLGPWVLGGYGSEPNRVFSNLSTVSLTLKGETAERIIRLDTSTRGSLFTVSGSVTLILDENITLQGHAENNRSLLQINSSSTLVMETGSKITGNGNTSSSGGGGVSVTGGTFTMNGGEISGNTGGVSVDGGTFTLQGNGKVALNNSVYLQYNTTTVAPSRHGVPANPRYANRPSITALPPPTKPRATASSVWWRIHPRILPARWGCTGVSSISE
jgi:hypothetical protein